MTKRAILLIAVAGCLLTNPAPAQLELAAVPLSGAVAGDLIKKFEAAASRLLYEGENRGNALLVSFGNQLQVAIRNADLALAGQQNTLFDNLSKTEQEFFTELNAIVNRALGPIDRAISVVEVANLNLIELTNRLPLTEKTYSYINSVHGLTQPHQDTDYEIVFSGLGFGQDQPSARYELSVAIDDTPLPVVSLSRVPPYQLKVQVASDMLESKFSDSAVTFASLDVSAKVRVKERCWVAFRCEREHDASWPLKLTLLPRSPGQLSGVELIKGEALDGQTKTTSVTVTTRGCKTDKPCDWNREVRLANNERVTGVRYACKGQCGWSYNLRKGGYAPDYDILEGGTKVVVYRHVDGEHTTTVTYYVDYQTLKTKVTEKSLKPVPLAFGDVKTIKLSPENKACAYRLTSRLVTGQDLFLDNNMTQSPDGLIVRISPGTGPSGTACSPSFVLNIP